MPASPSDVAQLVWIRLARAYRAALAGMESALKKEGLPPLDWYDALLELRRASDGLRPMELERRMLLAQYNVSRLVERLANEHLVDRDRDPSDGRGKVARITEAGLSLLERSWPVYRAAIQARIGSRLTEEEAATLADLLSRLVDDPSPAHPTSNDVSGA